MELKFLKDKKITYLVLALAAGILMIILSGTFTPKKSEPSPSPETEDIKPDAGYVEKRLEEIIGTVKGVSDVSVFITYENNGVKNTALITEDNRSEDGQKSQSVRKDNVVMYKDSSGEKPFVKEEILPEVRGVIVTAVGVSDERTKLLIADAVASAVGVPIYKVKVLPKN